MRIHNKRVYMTIGPEGGGSGYDNTSDHTFGGQGGVDGSQPAITEVVPSRPEGTVDATVPQVVASFDTKGTDRNVQPPSGVSGINPEDGAVRDGVSDGTSPRGVAAMAKSGDDERREVHSRVPDDAIPTAADRGEEPASPPPLQAGDPVTGPGGAGEFVRYEDRRQGRYVVIDTGEGERLVPEARFAELYTRPVVESGQGESADETSTEADPLTRRKDALRLQIEESIDAVSGSYDPAELDLTYGSERARERVAALMGVASERRYLFHTDTRHPTRVSAAEREEGVAGIFDEGLIARSEEPGFGVFTTPIPGMAMRYPEEGDVPEGWDGKKYVYLVDIEGVVDNPDRVRVDLGAIGEAQDVASGHATPQIVEIESGTIAANRVANCLEIDSNGNRLLRVHTNKGYGVSPQEQE